MSSPPQSMMIGVDAPSSSRQRSDPKTNWAVTTNGRMTAIQTDRRMHGRDNVDVVNKSRKHPPPPSAPLPPLPPSEAAATSVPRSTPGSPVQLSELHNSTRRSRNAELEQMPADAPQTPTLRVRPTGAAPSRIALRHSKHDVGEDFDFGIKHKLASFSPYVPDAPQLATPPESVPPPPPPKSGLLKRFRTRLAGTRSSPTLRPSESPNEPSTKGGRVLINSSPPLPTHQEEEQHEAVTVTGKPAGEATPVPPVPPGRRVLPFPVSVPDRKQKPATNQPAINDRKDQSLNGLNSRLSLAAFAEKRAEKREAKAREERRTTEARRAAALARTGLLSASRRYSVINLPGRGNGLDQFDPFAKDAALEGSEDGVVVDEPRSIVGDKEEEIEWPTEAGMSAAETVIREWRERNAHATRANGASPFNGFISEMSGDNNGLTKLETHPETSPIRSNSEGVIVKSTQANERVAGTTTPSNVSRECTMSPPAGTPDPAVVDSGSVLQRSKRHQSPQASTNVSSDSKIGSGEIGSRGKQVRRGKGPTIEKDALFAGESEKAELASWRFPASPAASPELSVSPRKTEKGDIKQLSPPFSPRSASSGSTAVANQGKAPTTSSAQDIPPPPPPKPKKDVIEESDGGKGKSSSSEMQPQSSLPSPSSPQKQLSMSPTTPSTASTSPYSRLSPSTGPSISPTRRAQAQKYINRLAAAPSQAAAIGLSLPTLSPTTSTNTSTTSGSALPRTPSTSSHGHSPVRVLDAPLANEENALHPHDDEHEPQELRRIRQATKVSGVKEFGQLAKLAELELELEQDPDSGQSEFGSGALPSLPLNLFSNSSTSTPSFGNDVTPNTKDRARLAEENDRRKRTTLFGRRRTAPNGPPMISIPESNPSAPVLAGKDNGLFGGKNQKQQQPRHASSFTNIRRTVTSVTTGFAAAGIKPSSSRNCSPLRGATLPIAARSSATSAGGLQSNDYCNYDANLLSPNSASSSTLEQRQRAPGVGLRLRPLNPTMHSRGSILLETHAIEDAESRRLAELAFLD